MESACLLTMRCPVWRWREPYSGSDREHGKSSSDAKGKAISVNHEMQNTDAFEDDGSSSSSVEASVMDGERRGRHS
jgi:hypothetical protein